MILTVSLSSDSLYQTSLLLPIAAHLLDQDIQESHGRITKRDTMPLLKVPLYYFSGVI
jgi:hypothetical protein